MRKVARGMKRLAGSNEFRAVGKVLGQLQECRAGGREVEILGDATEKLLNELSNFSTVTATEGGKTADCRTNTSSVSRTVPVITTSVSCSHISNVPVVHKKYRNNFKNVTTNAITGNIISDNIKYRPQVKYVG